jgi:hypothetical protein
LVVAFQQGAYIGEETSLVETGVVFPVIPPAPQPLPKPGPGSKCVETAQQFQNYIKSCNQQMNESSCFIDICRIKLLVPEAIDSVLNDTKVSIFQTKISFSVARNHVQGNDVFLMVWECLGCFMAHMPTLPL